MKTIFFKISIFLSLSFLGSCQVQETSTTWVHPQLRTHLVTKSEVSSLTFWKRGAQGLFFKDLGSKLHAFKLLGDTPLVMVSFNFNSMLAMQLAGDSRTLIHHQGSPLEPGYALVDVTDKTYHASLSQAAHTQSLRGLACGNIVAMNINTTMASEVDIIPPIYDESFKLEDVASLSSQANSSNIAASISTIEAMGTRRHMTDTGIAAPQKIKEMFEAVATNIAGIEYEFFDHNSAQIAVQQNSLIVRIPGRDSIESNNIIVIGAHLDSTNSGGSTLDAPGADDDASGIATLIEMVRAISNSGATFKRTIEFHAYGAEEDGLIGSGHIAQTYASQSKKVAAMFQIDMNSYSKNASSKTIYLVENDTSPTLRRSVKDLLNTYLGGDYIEKSLAAGTSDHRSWTYAGYAAVFPFEDPTAYNEALHTANDTSETANNIGLSERFAALGLTFISHHGGLVSAESQYTAAGTTSTIGSDLKLAIIKSAIDGYFNIGIGTEDTVENVEVCVIEIAGSSSCVDERVSATLSTAGSTRNLFLTDSLISLKSGKRIAIFGYDSAEKLVFQRSVLLSSN
jgi:hypothetical protein